jgi:hypothetical protein
VRLGCTSYRSCFYLQGAGGKGINNIQEVTPVAKHGSFATAINCMDGRVQVQVYDYIKKKYQVDYVDMITEPGPNKILADNSDQVTIESIKRRVEISTRHHGSNSIAIVGHYDCAGNPSSKEVQLEHISAAKKLIRSWGFQGELLGLWVDENWQVNEV